MSSPGVRVLVVDDSVVVRSVVARALDDAPQFEVAALARNGSVALDKLAADEPDVMVVDLDMPVMDGFETITAVRRTHPDLPIIVFSHLTHAGATATLDALALGATGFALKPSADGIGMAQDLVRDELLPLIAAVAKPRNAGPPAPIPPRASALPRSAVTAVVVAVSTGGPNVLAEIVPALPPNLAVPVFIVQHMPAMFTEALAKRLNESALLDVVEAADSDPVVAGKVYIAPGGRHMALRQVGERVEIALHDEEPENSCRPSADVLFRSAAKTYGRGVVAVVLTGMGSDGQRGCEVVHAAGGTVIVQEGTSCVVSSMPSAVAAAGLAHAVLRPADIGPTLTEWIGGGGQ